MSATTTAAQQSFTDPNQVPGGVNLTPQPGDLEYNAVQTVANNITNPQLPAGATIDPTLIQNSPDQEQQYQQLNGTAPGATQAAQGTTTTAAQPDGATASTYGAKTVSDQTPEMRAAQGSVDPRSLVEAQTADPSQNATVSGQLQQLLSGDMPWAAGAMRNANEEMARRGLGTSSMAGQAITQAAIESALPVAQANASIFAQFEMANLNNRQQSAVLNAQKYHDVNIKNLDNRQQARLMNQQARLNTLLSDQAAVNASRQFNAANQTEVDKFNTNLESQINQFNAAQANGMSQFNTGQKNSFSQFRATLQSQREQFNTQMRAQIDQSNVAWRRQINTANTAAVNQANQTNALNTLNLSNWSLNAMWQQWRDDADHYFTSSESAKNRSYGLAYATLMNAFSKDMAAWQSDQATARALGGWAADILNGLFKSDLFN